MISANLSAVFYLISGILFILALRGLSSPDTSRQGNYFGIAGRSHFTRCYKQQFLETPRQTLVARRDSEKKF